MKIIKTEFRIKKISGIKHVDRYRDVYEDGIKSKWKEQDPPMEINAMKEFYFERIAKKEGVSVAELKKVFIPSKVSK